MPGLTVAEPKQPTIVQPGEAEQQLVRGYREAGEQMEARTAPLRSEMQSLEQSITQESKNAPAPPKLQPVPQFQGREHDRNEALLVGNLALALGAIMGRSVRGDIGLALNTAGEAMKGYNQGNIEQARIERENFNTKMHAIVANNKTMLEEYDRVMKDRTLSMTQKMNQFRILSTRYNDEVGMAAAKKGDIRFELERLDKIRTANNQLETRLAQMDQHWREMEARLEATVSMARARASNAGIGESSQLTPEAIELYARAWIKDKNAVAGLGRGVQGARDLRAIANKAAEIMAAEGGKDLTQTRAEMRADANSLNRLTMSYDAVVAFEQTAVRNGRILVDLANKVDVTGMPVIERWIRSGRQNVEGDPDVSAFNAQMQVYRTEAARILTNPNLSGQLTDSARKEVEHFLSGSDSAEQITRVVALLERDFDNRKGTLVQQMDAIRDRMTRGYGAGGAVNPALGAGPKDGDKAKSKSGRPMVFRNNRWEYE